MNTTVKDLSTAGGTKWEFKPEDGDWAAMQVPGAGYRNPKQRCNAGEYRARLVIPKAAKDCSIRLIFEAVNFGCEIFVGADESTLSKCGEHVGGWVPVVADLFGIVEPGQSYLLVVRVRGRQKFQHERFGGNWAWNGDYTVSTVKQWTIPQGAAWLEDLAEGIIRGVRLEISPATYLSEPFVTTSTSQNTLHAFVKVNNTAGKSIQGFIRQRLRTDGDRSFAYPALYQIPFSLEAHETRRFDMIQTPWGLGTESYWWPNVPFKTGFRSVLHVLELEVVIDGKVVHMITQRFGFREFTWKGNRFYLNGIKCNLRGDNQQEANFGTDAYGTHPGFGKPSRGNAGWPGAVTTLLRLNFNVMRIHQIPPTKYMLDVCDELGLMIIDETPVRNSEVLEDWIGGWENMLASVADLVRRDRNHPSVIIWAVANEIFANRPLALALQGAAWSADWTRPVIIDGVFDLGPELINMQHYVSGLGVFPAHGGQRRTDRPYGETEALWPMDNSLQGFVWMATSTRHRRLLGNADIRNYVLNNAFPNYVPGHGRDQQALEKKVKNIQWKQVTSGMEILPDIKSPWTDPNIILMQKCFNPCTACDLKYDQENQLSNDKGEWPVKKSALPADSLVRRMVAVFNDTFDGEMLTFSWQARSAKKVIGKGSVELQIPQGEHLKLPIEFKTPKASGKLQLELKVSKAGKIIFADDLIVFAIGE